MKRPGNLALWTASISFGVFALAGALVGPIMLIAVQGTGSAGVVWPLWMAFRVMTDSGIREPGFGILMLAGALIYGFIGFGLWLVCWSIFRFFHWGFTWKSPGTADHPQPRS
jgi:hypothetical protein